MPAQHPVRPTLSIPPLQISIFSVESMETPMRLVAEQRTSVRPNLSNFTKQLLDMDETASMAQVYGVELNPEQILCVSCLHPNSSKAYCLSQQMCGATVLPQQNCELDKSKTNLLYLAPSMQIKVMFRSAAPMPVTQGADNNNSESLSLIHI